MLDAYDFTQLGFKKLSLISINQGEGDGVERENQEESEQAQR